MIIEVPSNTITFIELDTANGYTHGIEAYRFCWTPSCDDVDEIYTINVEAYSMGCSILNTLMTILRLRF